MRTGRPMVTQGNPEVTPDEDTGKNLESHPVGERRHSGVLYTPEEAGFSCLSGECGRKQRSQLQPLWCGGGGARAAEFRVGSREDSRQFV